MVHLNCPSHRTGINRTPTSEVRLEHGARPEVMRRLWFAVLCLLAGCAHAQLVGARGAALNQAALFITEVAQSAELAGATADRVEVYSAAAGGCASFRVCDSTASAEGSCSAAQPALAAGQRSLVSRGTSITSSDQVWLADATSVEQPGTRVGPFACAAGQSQARNDCAEADFGACGVPSLGGSSGACPVATAFSCALAFTQNQHGQPETSCNRPICQQLVAAIDAATRSIDFAVYGVRGQPRIIDALAAAQARGVRVRGVVDSENADCSAFGYPDTPVLIGRLTPGSVVCDVGSGYGYIMHNKFFVFDAKQVWTGSTNLSDTESGGEYNSDVAALIASERLASIYGSEFEEMFGGLFHRRKTDNTEHVVGGFSDGTTIQSYFSPTDHAIENAVIPLIERATASLDVAMFYFTDASIAAALTAAKQRGVRVRMVLDAGGAANQYAAHVQPCAAGIEVKVENWGGKSHSKWAVADAALPEAAAVVFGSMNWTGAGNGQNDENTLYIKNARLAAEFAAEFERQWLDLAAAPACTSVNAESAGSSVCSAVADCSASCTSGACCDGLDNDYDGRVDLQEEACACADGVDNDGDGYVDAADFDCRPAQEDP